jgi:hypothetical protein
MRVTRFLLRVTRSQALPNVVFRGATSPLRITCHSFFDLTLAFKTSMRVDLVTLILFMGEL